VAKASEKKHFHVEKSFFSVQNYIKFESVAGWRKALVLKRESFLNKIVKLLGASCIATVTSPAVSAGTITFDFESLTANIALSSITVGTTVFNVASSVNEAILFDTLDPTTSDHVGDPDIIPAVQGENGVG
jgi:hypothetical protein